MALKSLGRGTRGAVHRHGLEVLKHVTSTTTPVVAYGILLENGSSLLQESGSHTLLEFNTHFLQEGGTFIILLESGFKLTKES